MKSLNQLFCACRSNSSSCPVFRTAMRQSEMLTQTERKCLAWRRFSETIFAVLLLVFAGNYCGGHASNWGKKKAIVAVFLPNFLYLRHFRA